MAVACDSSRLFPSFALFSSFFLLGVFVSALGPAVPSLSRDIGVREVTFGMAFSLRGLGYLLGSWFSSVILPASGRGECVRHALNDRMNRLGAATAGIGLFSLALNMAGTFRLVCAWCFFQGFCGGAIDAIANTAISAVHGIGVAPWMQGLHFCFSAGALVAPAAVGQFGYRAVFLLFGLLAMPAGLACCLAGASGSCCARRGEGMHHLLVESDELADVTTTIGGGGMKMVEMVGGKRAEEQPPGVDLGGREKLAGRREEVHSNIASSSITLRKDALCSSPTKETLTGDDNAENSSGQQTTASSVGAVTSQERDEDAREEGQQEEHASLMTSPSYESDKVSRFVLEARQQQLDVEAPPPKDEGGEEEAKPPPFSLVGLLALFLFLYVGAEVGFGAWIAVVVLRDDLAGEGGAALMASLFWGGITVGRLVAVPLAVRFSTGSLMQANLIGGVSSSALLLVVGRDRIAWAAIGAALFGLFMASTFPLAMSLLPSVAYALSDKNSSRMVIGGALGEMLVPALIAALLGSSDGGWPSALYTVCTAISILLLLVYGAWCSVLAAIGRRTDQG